MENENIEIENNSFENTNLELTTDDIENEENKDEVHSSNLEENEINKEFEEKLDLDQETVAGDQYLNNIEIEENLDSEKLIEIVATENMEKDLLIEDNLNDEQIDLQSESDEKFNNENVNEESVTIFIENIIDSLISNIFTTTEETSEDSKTDLDEKISNKKFMEYHNVDRIEEAIEPEEDYCPELENKDFENENIADIEIDEQHEEEEIPNEEEILNEEEIKLNKEELIQELIKASAEEKILLEFNTSLQHKIGNYLRKKKVDQTSSNADEKGIIDFDQKYNKQIEILRELMKQYEYENNEYENKIEVLQSETSNIEETVKKEKEKFQNYRFAISQKSINTRTGKNLSPKDIELLSINEEKKESLVVETRLISIKLQNDVSKIDSILKSKEELADGLHLIDFEQFKIENQSYNEKLEERTEDLLKLRKKITSHVHNLTHIKEKLEFVKHECVNEQKMLTETDERLTKYRDQLTSLKQSRDKLRSSNQKLKKSCGMLGNGDLLRNYENCVDTVNVQMRNMNEMKNKQIKLTLRNQALQMKIDNVRLES